LSPTVFRESGFKFLFYSREEARLHIHVFCGNGSAKFWLEPEIALAENYGLRSNQIRRAFSLIEEHQDEIKRRWQEHFGS